jgi:hypothetical protein
VKYLLTMMTDGRRDCLLQAIDAFERMVTPKASAAYIHIDGMHMPPPMLYDELQWQVTTDPEPVGFCHSQANVWRAAASSKFDWVFHLEDDFVIQRPVDLTQFAAVLDAEPQCAQMILYRNAVVHEIPHGGYLNQFRDSYTPRATWIDHGDGVSRLYPWFETQRNWATNPALFRSQFCRDHRWPTDPNCEGLLSFQVRETHPETTFGIWGNGEVWAEHIGKRQGFGY